MSGVGEDHSTYQPLREALRAHAKETYGDEYEVQDFVIEAFVVNLEDSDKPPEYLLVTSTQADHVILGLAEFIRHHTLNSTDEDDE